jgi:hypothetical protein
MDYRVIENSGMLLTHYVLLEIPSVERRVIGGQLTFIRDHSMPGAGRQAAQSGQIL